MDRHFMIDIESTGIQPETHELLQIGILECKFNGARGYWEPGNQFNQYVFTGREPQSEFARKHQGELYKRCGAEPFRSGPELRRMLLGFILGCGIEHAEKTFFMGWNASNFDLPFLCAKGVLNAPGYVTGSDGRDQSVGDFNYRVYEIGGAISVAQNVLGLARTDVIVMADEFNSGFDLPAGAEHDAIYDCYKQLRTLNGIIHLLKAAQ